MHTYPDCAPSVLPIQTYAYMHTYIHTHTYTYISNWSHHFVTCVRHIYINIFSSNNTSIQYLCIRIYMHVYVCTGMYTGWLTLVCEV